MLPIYRRYICYPFTGVTGTYVTYLHVVSYITMLHTLLFISLITYTDCVLYILCVHVSLLYKL